MSRKRGNETDIIHADWWDEDETVVIRKHLTHGMSKAINQAYAASIDRSTFNPDDPTSMKVDPAKALDAADTPLLYWIVSWTLKDENNHILPPTQATLNELLEEDVKFIADEIAKRSGGMTEEQEQAFLPTPSAGTEA